MKVINIYGYFGFKNIGDDLMLMNFLDYIDSCALEQLRVRIFCKKNSYSFKKYNRLEIITIEVNKLINYVISYYYIFYSDKGIWVGGTCLYEPENKNISGLKWLLKLVKKYQQFKKPFYFINIGIGSLYSSNAIEIVKDILSYTKNVSFREEKSLSKAYELGVNTKGFPGGDMVFLNSQQFRKYENIAYRNLFGFCGHEQYANDTYTVEFYAKQLQDLSDGYDKIIFISMHGNEDHKFHKKIAKLIQKDYSFLEYENYEILFQEMKQLKFLLGMRLHSIILADLLAIPNIGIAYGEKVSNYIRKTNILVNSRIKHVNEKITIFELNEIVDHYKQNGAFINAEESCAQSGIDKVIGDLLD